MTAAVLPGGWQAEAVQHVMEKTAGAVDIGEPVTGEFQDQERPAVIGAKRVPQGCELEVSLLITVFKVLFFKKKQ